jgi:hypothetical protein
MLFEIDEPKPGSGGTVTLWANGKQIGEGRLDHTCSMLFTTYAGMDMGRDNGGVVDDYEDRAPYAFTGDERSHPGDDIVLLLRATPEAASRPTTPSSKRVVKSRRAARRQEDQWCTVAMVVAIIVLLFGPGGLDNSSSRVHRRTSTRRS